MTHLIVDGYNVIRRIPEFLAAERESLESGRDALLLTLEAYAARFGYRVTVVFDAGSRPARMGPETPRSEHFAGIDVLFSDRGESADKVIVRLVVTLRQERRSGEAPVDGCEVVISDDVAIRDEALEHGAFVKSSDDLFEAMYQKQPLVF